MSVTSAMGLTTAVGIFKGYNQATGLPVFTSDTMGEVCVNPVLGWVFICLDLTLGIKSLWLICFGRWSI